MGKGFGIFILALALIETDGKLLFRPPNGLSKGTNQVLGRPPNGLSQEIREKRETISENVQVPLGPSPKDLSGRITQRRRSLS